MKRYFINIGKTDVHITEWGNKKNPVIFCLHGLGGTSLNLIEIAEQVEEYEMPRLATWLNSLLDHFEIGQFYLAEYPERVKGSILIDGGYQTKRLKNQTMEEEVAYYEKDKVVVDEIRKSWSCS